jgi:hypothetical protein
MPLRYVFGPVSPAFAAQKLTRVRQAGECLAFNASGDVDVRIGLEDTWEAVLLRLPAGWQPDFVALHLPYSVIPSASGRPRCRAWHWPGTGIFIGMRTAHGYETVTSFSPIRPAWK